MQIKIRRDDFTTFTRQQAVAPPVNGTDQIYAVACRLLDSWLSDNPGVRIRLLGVGGSKLTPANQADLFTSDPKRAGDAVDSTVDEIRKRFGAASLRRASTLDRPDPERLD